MEVAAVISKVTPKLLILETVPKNASFRMTAQPYYDPGNTPDNNYIII